MHESPRQQAARIGQRLKQARLNANLTQSAVAARAGVSRKAVQGAEAGRVQLETLLAILQALALSDQLDRFLPEPPPSPLQLARLHGQRRQRASGGEPLRRADEKDDAPW